MPETTDECPRLLINAQDYWLMPETTDYCPRLLIIFRDPRLQFNNALSFISLINNKNTVNPSKNYKIKQSKWRPTTYINRWPTLLFVFLFHSASMAEQDISPGLEIVGNPDASGAIDGNEGRLTTPTDLAQAIVADREFIAKISSAIWANIAPNLNLSNVTGSNPNASAVPEGQAEELNPGVSVDQTGISESSAIVNPVVSVDQSGAEKRTLVPNIDSKMPAKRPRTCLAPEPDGLENANNDSIDDEFLSPNSRWEASEELTEFLGTSAKRLSRFERRSLVKFYPRPNVDSVYTPALDEYLKPFIQGVSAPDKPLKELQDNILDIFGLLSTVYENLIAMLHTIGSDAFIQLDKESISTFLTCVKRTMLLVGDVSSRVVQWGFYRCQQAVVWPRIWTASKGTFWDCRNYWKGN